MNLLYPIYLWSLLLLFIPIAIHLFSKNNPARIKIGSVKFLEQAETRTFRRVKFHDSMLFALRALIFALLSVLIASPEIACKYKASGSGWILVEPSIRHDEQPKEFHQHLDSLQKAGYEMRALANAFPKTVENRANTKLDLWSLLAEADKANADTLTFYIASTLRENSLQGKRPTLSREVRWIDASAGEATWIERVAQLSDDSLFIAIGISSANETRFEHLITPNPDKTTVIPPIELTRQGDSLSVNLISKPNEKRWLSLTKKETWRIVYDEHFATMLPYIERAVKAIAQFSPIKISVEVIKQTEWQHEAESQIIWLCKREPPEYPKLLDARAFNTESFFDEKFIHALSESLLPESVSENDVRKASSQMAKPITRRTSKTLEERKHSLVFPIWILVTLLVGLERWIAFSKE
ncbi:MAG: BatA domain-containing protein [Chloroherpetonaceae bacterium]